MSEPTFEDQIATVLRVAAELEGRWVVQKCRYGIWAGIMINAIMPEAPVSQMWVPFSAQDTYESSGEAVDEMERLRTIDGEVPMRVRPVEDDIETTCLSPRTGTEKREYGDTSITWGEVKQKFSTVVIQCSNQSLRKMWTLVGSDPLSQRKAFDRERGNP